MIDDKATRALRAMRAHRIRLARFRNGPREEYFRDVDRHDYARDYWFVADWLDVREKVSAAFDDPARLAEDAQGAPPTIICPITPGTFNEFAHWPWETYLNRRQLRDRRRRNNPTKVPLKTRR